MKAGKEQLEIRKSIKRFSYNCFYCGIGYTGDNPLTVDHKRPKIKRGKDSEENLVPCCLWCNQTKSSGRFDLYVEWCARMKKVLLGWPQKRPAPAELHKWAKKQQTVLSLEGQKKALKNLNKNHKTPGWRRFKYWVIHKLIGFLSSL